jgi:hypothetical protein
MPIILARRGKPAQRLVRTVIQNESYLQKYIADNPDVLPLDQLSQEIRPLLLLREFPTPSGPIDTLATDQDGNLYLIETKLYKNPDKRIVLAQVLDYGAAIWKAYPDPDEFIRRLDILMTERDGKGLIQRLKEAYGREEDAADEFLASLRATVTAGSFRFVVLMDRIDDRLKDLIAYVNANSEFDILGVALDFYQHEDLDILIPTLHGAERKPPTGRNAARRPSWDAQRVFADAETRLPTDQLQALRSLHDWAQLHADEVSYGTGRRTGSFSPKWAAISPRSVFTAGSDGVLTLNFKWLTEPASTRTWRQCFGQALIEKGFSLPPDFEERFVYLRPNTWVPLLQVFLNVLSAQVGRLE